MKEGGADEAKRKGFEGLGKDKRFSWSADDRAQIFDGREAQSGGDRVYHGVDRLIKDGFFAHCEVGRSEFDQFFYESERDERNDRQFVDAQLGELEIEA